MIPVYCLNCGAELRRAEDPAGDAGRPCFLWFDLAGERADTCPQCGAVTSLLTTADGPAILGRLANLPPADRAMFFDLVDRFLEDVTPA